MRASLVGAVCLLAGCTIVPGLLMGVDGTLVGVVGDEAGAVAGARVRWRGQRLSVLSDRRGRFALPVRQESTVTVSKPGYFIASASGRAPLRLLLEKLPDHDNDEYDWLSAGDCRGCHRQIHDEWSSSAHARAATNRRFLNLHEGSDWHGQRSKTWSVRDEHPLGAGVCATCHLPSYRDPTIEYDPRLATGVAAGGVHCDFCHKVADVALDDGGLRFGRDALQLLRPTDDRRFFFGPLDDAVRSDEDFVHAPVYRESRYCASCHEGVIFGVHAYGTYSEWLRSPARKRGQQCQNCHMPASGTLTNIAPGIGGIERPPHTLTSHAMPDIQSLLRRSVRLDVQTERLRGGVAVAVELLASNVGHRVPTGFIDRQLLLVVEARTDEKEPAALFDGDILPTRAGAGFAGQAGKLFAKQRLGSDDLPIPFWMPHRQLIDTRLQPEVPERHAFRFAADTAEVRVRLLYRRFWHDTIQSKSWPDEDVIVAERRMRVKRED